MLIAAMLDINGQPIGIKSSYSLGNVPVLPLDALRYLHAETGPFALTIAATQIFFHYRKKFKKKEKKKEAVRGHMNVRNVHSHPPNGLASTGSIHTARMLQMLYLLCRFVVLTYKAKL